MHLGERGEALIMPALQILNSGLPTSLAFTSQHHQVQLRLNRVSREANFFGNGLFAGMQMLGQLPAARLQLLRISFFAGGVN